MYRVAAAEALRWGVEQCVSTRARAVSLLCRLGSRSLGACVTLECAAFEATARASVSGVRIPCHCSSVIYLYLISYLTHGGISPYPQ